MFKTISAIASAAAIAAVITIMSSPAASVDAGPLAEQEQATLKTCTQREWPYLNCVGTALGDKKIRVISTQRVNPTENVMATR